MTKRNFERQLTEEFGIAYRLFYFGDPGSTRQLRRKLWLASIAIPGSPNAADLCEELFLGPIRHGNHAHFRRISDHLKKIDNNSGRPPEAQEFQDDAEHHVFCAFRIFLARPLLLGRLPQWREVKDLSLD